MASELELRNALCEIGRTLFERGHNAPGDGNWSVRLGPDELLCSPSGVHKGRLEPPDIVKMRLSDRGVLAGGKPSTEIRMHLQIYRLRPDVRAIVHAHSAHAVGLSVAGVSLEHPVVPEAIQLLGSVPTVPYTSPTTQQTADAVGPYAEHHNAWILERHGVVALGSSLEEAYMRLEVVEHTARITLIALSAGSARPIEAGEAARLRSLGGIPDARPATAEP